MGRQMMVMGMTLGAGGKGVPLASFSGATAPNSGGLFTLPSFLTIACATTGRTSQQSASTLLTGFGANAARARNVGSGWGLHVEAPSTVVMPSPSDFSSGWSKQTNVVVTVDQAVAPDGTSTADLIDLTAASAATGVFPVGSTVVNGTFYSASIWLRTVSGAGTVNLANAQATIGNPSFGLTTAWRRCDFAEAASGTNIGAPWLRKGSAAQIYAWGAQYGTGKIPGSYTVGSKTRAADVLSSTASVVAPGGFFDVAMTIAPNYANTEQAADHDLFFLDSNNRTFLRQADAKIVQRIGGVDVISAALTFARDASVSVRSSHRAAGRALTVNGVPVTGAAAAAVSLPASAFWLGNASGAQESADLRSVSCYRP